MMKVESSARAVCNFCSRSDNSIQVICEAKCLLCSRCQIVPGIRKLLIEHSSITDLYITPENLFCVPINSATLTRKGFCPICEHPMSPSMLVLIEMFKESMRGANEDELAATGNKIGSEMDLEQPNFITAFLRRFRLTYIESVDGSKAAPIADTREKGGQDKSTEGKKLLPPALSKKVDIYAAVPTKSTLAGVLEFMVECYTSQWQSIIRGGNESMLQVMMRLSNKKKFSQRTNDFKTKSLVDYLSGPNGADFPDLLLFGHLLGVQPKLYHVVSPAWSHIATSIMVAATCERCLKLGQLNDAFGNPPPSELKLKLSKHYHPKRVVQPKTISAKKAVRILMLLHNLKHSYWIISPLLPHCLELRCKLPWQPESISKLLNVLVFITTYEAENEINMNGSIDSKEALSNDGRIHVASSDSNSTISLLRPTTFLTAASVGTLSIAENTLSSAAMEENARHNQIRLRLLKSLENYVHKIFCSTKPALQFNLQPNKLNKAQLIEHIRNSDRVTEYQYVPLIFESAFELVSGLTISLPEFCMLTIQSWETEHSNLKLSLAKGSVTSKRRLAISGRYDPKNATLSNVERLALMRILKFYRYDDNSVGLDWDEIEENCKENRYTFNIPQSLISKSRNELNYLVKKLHSSMKLQKLQEQYEDALSNSGPYSKAQGLECESPSTITSGKIKKSQSLMNLETIQASNRQNYLAQQSLGFVEPIKEILPKDTVDERHHTKASLQYELNKEQYLKHLEDVKAGRVVEEENKPVLRKAASEILDDQKFEASVSKKSRRVNSQEFKKSDMDDIKKLLLKSAERKDEKEDYMDHFQADNIELSESLTSAREKEISELNKDLEALLIDESASAYMVEQAQEILERSDLLVQEQKLRRDILRSSNSGTNSPHVSESEALQYLLQRKEREREEQALVDAKEMEVRLAILKAEKENMVDEKTVVTTRVKLVRDAAPDADPKVMRLKHGEGYNALDSKYEEIETKTFYSEFNHYNSSTDKKSRKGAASREISTPDVTAITEENFVDQYYKSMLRVHRKKRVEDAYKRVNQRAELHKDKDKKENEHFEDTNSITSNYTALDDNKSIQETRNYLIPTNSVIQFLDLGQHVDSNGMLRLNLANDLSLAAPVKVIFIRDSNISLQGYKYLLETFLTPQKLESLIKLDFGGNPLGLSGAIALNKKVSVYCRLIHINLNGHRLGDMGLRKVLQGIVDGGGAESLLRLDLQENEITIATDGFLILKKLKNLRALDLSKNCFALDTRYQKDVFIEAVGHLHDLQSLSLAFNKIQDSGFDLLVQLIKASLPKLSLLSLIECFITSKSYGTLKRLMSFKTTEDKPQIEELLLQGNIFSLAQTQEITNPQNDLALRVFLDYPYRGIEYPLRYEPTDYGVEIYNC